MESIQRGWEANVRHPAYIYKVHDVHYNAAHIYSSSPQKYNDFVHTALTHRHTGNILCHRVRLNWIDFQLQLRTLFLLASAAFFFYFVAYCFSFLCMYFFRFVFYLYYSHIIKVIGWITIRQVVCVYAYTRRKKSEHANTNAHTLGEATTTIIIIVIVLDTGTQTTFNKATGFFPHFLALLSKTNCFFPAPVLR